MARTWRLLKNGWFYLPIQKAASSSIRTQQLDHRYHELNGPTFTVVRNPWDRLVSAWTDRGKDIAPKVTYFGEFVRWVAEQDQETMDAHIRPQYIGMEPYPDLIIPFDYMKDMLKDIGLEIPHTNLSQHKEWQHYYSDELKAIVRQTYQRDFEIWEKALNRDQ